ncbi:helix-turn-helix domain-containing protein [Bacteroides gallinaceum]|uniref:helix-turn-helix domain-containing protein n=1 Tax=Bacteroides gallinaceum TaxID=1462571 RepID=UPI003D327745
MNSLLKPQKLWYRLHSSKSCLTNLSNEIKTASHVPANKFAVLFKVFACCSFSQYIQNCRLDYAVRLMREQPQWTLDAIAKEAQMSKGAFNIQFHKRYGMKPSEFRSRELSLDEEK